jgi:hypothetical protein
MARVSSSGTSLRSRWSVPASNCLTIGCLLGCLRSIAGAKDGGSPLSDH